MTNKVAQSKDALFAQALAAADGLGNHPKIAVMYSTESVIRAGRDTARTANNAYQAAKGARLAAAELQSTKDANGRAFILKARKTFESFLGSEYSQAWNEVGFTNNTLALPGTLAKRAELVSSIAAYLENHPEHEVAPLSVTAALATAQHTALSDAISGLNTAWGAQFAAREEADTEAEALRGLLRGLIDELTRLIGLRDPRWMDFGFNIPYADTTPDVLEGLTVVNGVPGHLVVRWGTAARAARYRVFRQVVGVDPGLRPGANAGGQGRELEYVHVRPARAH
jgi:hypothetical protein